MNVSRRHFLEHAAAWTACAGCAGAPAGETCRTLPPWRPGELELHFVYTGCGENLFYRLPDGTSVLNDTGDFYRPRDRADVPLLPDDGRLGGDWMARYLHRVFDGRTIDYAVFSHWHSDHIGHAGFAGDGKTETDPNGALRYRTTPDGRKINGFLCVAEDFGFRRCFDHQYPARGAYGTQDSSLQLLVPWIDDQRRKGLSVEPFEVGARDQIALLHEAAKYKGLFSIRNICANGVLWDGAHGTHDYAAERVEETGRKKISQNFLSLGFAIEYGKFRYWAGGDVSGSFRTKTGATVDYEAKVGERVGPVSVCKMNHHGCTDAMHEGFVKAVRAQTYVSCMWCPRQAHAQTLQRLVRIGAYDGSTPLLLLNLVCGYHKENEAAFGYTVPPRGAYHVVVKVQPGGAAYKVYLLDASDEAMRVVSVSDVIC